MDKIRRNEYAIVKTWHNSMMEPMKDFIAEYELEIFEDGNRLFDLSFMLPNFSCKRFSIVKTNSDRYFDEYNDVIFETREELLHYLMEISTLFLLRLFKYNSRVFFIAIQEVHPELLCFILDLNHRKVKQRAVFLRMRATISDKVRKSLSAYHFAAWILRIMKESKVGSKAMALEIIKAELAKIEKEQSIDFLRRCAESTISNTQFINTAYILIG